MRIRYDRLANAAYIYLVSRIEPGQVTKVYQCDIKVVKGMINLDFDSDGRLLGIEVLDADRYLSKELLDQAEIIG